MRSLRFVMPCTWGANIIISTRTVFPLSDFMQPISGMYFKTIAISSSHPRFFLILGFCPNGEIGADRTFHELSSIRLRGAS